MGNYSRVLYSCEDITLIAALDTDPFVINWWSIQFAVRATCLMFWEKTIPAGWKIERKSFSSPFQA
jgi:hypothetical protein